MIEFIEAFVLEVAVEGMGPRSARERRVFRAYVQSLAAGTVTAGIS